MNRSLSSASLGGISVKKTWKNDPIGHGSLVVQETDSRPACHKFEPSTAEDPQCRGSRCTLNMSKLKRPPVVVVRKLEEGVPAQVSFSSLDHGWKSGVWCVSKSSRVAE
ncbi:hypothetical protein TNCV_4428531 [Trichonephila clavipes]|nr:hypothetical protein TNCV_4428531 [Trichonephila clavipes]